MTSHVGRLYALAGTLVVFFGSWTAIAANPWSARPVDQRVLALQQRELRLQRDTAATQALVQRRWAAYRDALARRQATLASQRSLAQAAAVQAPSVRVVTLPPVTTTRSS